MIQENSYSEVMEALNQQMCKLDLRYFSGDGEDAKTQAWITYNLAKGISHLSDKFFGDVARLYGENKVSSREYNMVLQLYREIHGRFVMIEGSVATFYDLKEQKNGQYSFDMGGLYEEFRTDFTTDGI